MVSFFIRAVAHNVADIAVLTFVILAQAIVVYFLFRAVPERSRRWIFALCAASGVVLIVGFLLMFERVSRNFPAGISSWFRGYALIWGLLSMLWVGAFVLWKALSALVKPADSGARREFLKASGAVLFAAPLAITGYGVFVQRMRIRMREENIVIPNLAEDLVGIRIVQLTDIHLSPFLSEKELARAVAMANETYAHLALVTGDMISSRRDPLELCLKHLAGLRAEAGILGCLGNHEVYAQCEDRATELGARLGIRYLRSEAVRLKFGGATMNVAGVDYQQFRKPYLRGAQRLIEPGIFNVLLSHNPDVFPVAARQGYDLTISGHTHGGQVRVEILGEDLNIARFFTPYVDGLYQKDGKTIFVSRGIGTIGLPARLGSPPEVALLRLCRS